MVQSSRCPGDQKPTVYSRGKSGEGLKKEDKGTDNGHFQRRVGSPCPFNRKSQEEGVMLLSLLWGCLLEREPMVASRRGSCWDQNHGMRGSKAQILFQSPVCAFLQPIQAGRACKKTYDKDREGWQEKGSERQGGKDQGHGWVHSELPYC